ncbi:MAG: hypothetical protein WBS54_08110 [Acidobacteriota bacterium]
MNVRIPLVIQRQGAAFSPFIGAVDLVTDRGHCLVKGNAAALEKTWEDPSDDSRGNKASECLTTGAVVSVTDVASQASCRLAE